MINIGKMFLFCKHLVTSDEIPELLLLEVRLLGKCMAVPRGQWHQSTWSTFLPTQAHLSSKVQAQTQLSGGGIPGI